MRRVLPLIAAVPLLALTLVACGGESRAGGDGSGGRLSLVAYSTPKEAYGELIPAFARTPEGRGVAFTQSYGSSGDQSRAVASGLPADVVALSLEPDVTKLVDAGLVDRDWNAGAQHGFVTDSVVVLAVRDGNPKNIRGWQDLLRDDVDVITPNPFTSGGARWNIMAAYGAQLEQGRSPDQAVAYLRKLFENVSVQDKSARDSLQTFVGGKGDVLIAYENEAITARQKGEDLDYVIPDETILIQNPVAVVSKSKSAAKARAFIEFLRTPQAQRVFVEHGYRPVIGGVRGADRFPKPAKLFTIDRLGGWASVTKRFFGGTGSIVGDIEESLGVATG